jgi:outer membrane usher protein
MGMMVASVLASWPTLTLAALTTDATTTEAAADSAADDTSTSADDISSAEVSFDRAMLSGGGRNTSDLSRFERRESVMPGIYRTDVYLNNDWLGRFDVRLAATNTSATPCIGKSLFMRLGLSMNKLSTVQQGLLENENGCADMAQLVTDGTATFDQSELRLDLAVPQALLGLRARGYVDPKYWDNGVTAGLLNYHLNVNRNDSGGVSQTNAFLSLNAGFNIGSWRVRQDSYVTWASGGGKARWQSLATYVRRDIPSLRAQLTLGDSYTSGELFDSVSIRGAQLATDDRMLPDSLRGYAPTVRGVAETNARVTVRQGGVVLYETTVAPGPFVINDLYSTGYGGDLVVDVTEADGRVRSFNVPYASVPQLLRPGIGRFSLAVGQLRDASLNMRPAVAQATYQRGISNLLTGYAGVVGLDGYVSGLVGTALNTRFGAFSADLSVSQTQIPGRSSETGQRVRVSYSKTLPGNQTSFTLAAYRYSTSGYWSLRDAVAVRDRGIRDGDPALQGIRYRERSNFSLTLNQSFGKRGGGMFATATGVDYWGSKDKNVQYQLGYSNSIGQLNYSLSGTRLRDRTTGRYVNQFFARIMMPLGGVRNAPQFNASVNTDGRGNVQSQVGINGSAGAENQITYGASVSHNSGSGGAASGSVFGGYRSPIAQLNASFGKGDGYTSQSFGASGGLVVHSGGVTFGQSLGDTVGLVEARGAKGARVVSSTGTKVNGGGYALVPYMTPYNMNNVQIDPKGLPLSVQVDSTSAQVAPRLGSVVLMKFETSNGRALIVRVRQDNGQGVPFGAEVLDEQGHTLGVVGQAGLILARGVKDSGRLSVQWKDGDGTPQMCSFPYQIPLAKKNETSGMYEKIEAACTVQPGVNIAQPARNEK